MNPPPTTRLWSLLAFAGAAIGVPTGIWLLSETVTENLWLRLFILGFESKIEWDTSLLAFVSILGFKPFLGHIELAVQ